MNRSHFAFTCLVAVACLGLARVPLPADDKKEHSDKDFMLEAGQGGMFEVKLGQVAKEHASGDAVKKFGDRMVTDHSKANKELLTLAMKKGVSLPQTLDKKHQDMIDKLAKMKGEEFDRHYINHMVKDHEEDVAAFEAEVKRGQDADVKAWAAQTLPTIREHLQLAKKIQGKGR